MDPLKLKALQHYRHLLRAASYLPDEASRVYIRGHVRKRYRDAGGLTASRLSTAEKSVRILQRASDGELTPLTNVLMHTYGRTGRRKRELMVKFQRPNSISSTALEELERDGAVGADGTDADSTRSSWKPKNLSPSSALDALMQSQARNLPTMSAKELKIKSLRPVIPKENIWGRKTPLSVEASLNKRFWSETLRRVLPPLPESEWNELRDRATGVIPFKGAPPRRKPALSMEAASDTPFLDNLLTSKIQHPQSERNHLVNRHHITPRFMRRMWAGIWNHCPCMFQDPDQPQLWKVVWGGDRSAMSKGRIAEASGQDLQLFEGVGDLGGPTFPKKRKSRR